MSNLIIVTLLRTLIHTHIQNMHILINITHGLSCTVMLRVTTIHTHKPWLVVTLTQESKTIQQDTVIPLITLKLLITHIKLFTATLLLTITSTRDPITLTWLTLNCTLTHTIRSYQALTLTDTHTFTITTPSILTLTTTITHIQLLMSTQEATPTLH
jgi:hypothetical protein